MRSPVSSSAPILFTPFGAPVPKPTLQAHVRNAPFRFLPFEQTLARQIPGYRGQVGNGIYFFGRKDVLNSIGDSLWTTGDRPVELWVSSDAKLERPVFQIESPVAPNRISIELGGDGKTSEFSAAGPASAARVTLVPGAADGAPRRRRLALLFLQDVDPFVGADVSHRDRADEATDRGRGGGARAAWRAAARRVRGGDLPRRRDGDLPRRRARSRGRRLQTRMGRGRGAAGRELARQPPAPGAGDGEERERRELAGARLDPRRARLPLARGGRRHGRRRRSPQRPSADVAPGATAKVDLEIATPKKPGRYILRVGALRERLAWFADRDPGSVRTLTVDVLPSE